MPPAVVTSAAVRTPPPAGLSAVSEAVTGVVATLPKRSCTVKPTPKVWPEAGTGSGGACEVSAREVISSESGAAAATSNGATGLVRLPEVACRPCGPATVNTPLTVTLVAPAGAGTVQLPPTGAAPSMVARASAVEGASVRVDPTNGAGWPPALSAVTTMLVGSPATTGWATERPREVAVPSSTLTEGVGPDTVKMPPPIPMSRSGSTPAVAGATKLNDAFTVLAGSGDRCAERQSGGDQQDRRAVGGAAAGQQRLAPGRSTCGAAALDPGDPGGQHDREGAERGSVGRPVPHGQVHRRPAGRVGGAVDHAVDAGDHGHRLGGGGGGRGDCGGGGDGGEREGGRGGDRDPRDIGVECGSWRLPGAVEDDRDGTLVPAK